MAIWDLIPLSVFIILHGKMILMTPGHTDFLQRNIFGTQLKEFLVRKEGWWNGDGGVLQGV